MCSRDYLVFERGGVKGDVDGRGRDRVAWSQLRWWRRGRRGILIRQEHVSAKWAILVGHAPRKRTGQCQARVERVGVRALAVMVEGGVVLDEVVVLILGLCLLCMVRIHVCVGMLLRHY